MTKKTDGPRGRINFQSEQGYSCCGQLVLYDIEVGPIAQPSWLAGTLTTFNSKEEQFKDFTQRIETVLEKEAEHYNDDQYEDEEKLDCTYGFMSLTLTTHQIPGLIEYLLENGWQKDQEVQNPKTKNTIVALSKAL